MSDENAVVTTPVDAEAPKAKVTKDAAPKERSAVETPQKLGAPAQAETAAAPAAKPLENADTKPAEKTEAKRGRKPARARKSRSKKASEPSAQPTEAASTAPEAAAPEAAAPASDAPSSDVPAEMNAPSNASETPAAEEQGGEASKEGEGKRRRRSRGKRKRSRDDAKGEKSGRRGEEEAEEAAPSEEEGAIPCPDLAAKANHIPESPEIPLDEIDADALWVVRRLRAKGFEAYLTGGCVRDLLLGRKPKDFDVATAAHPHQVKAAFRNCRLVGRRFLLAHVYFSGGKVIETATFRANPLDTAEDLPDDLLLKRDNVYGDVQQDARRRDLTVNGLFYDPIEGKVLDDVKGRADLDARLIRTIGVPSVRFQEDPVRIIRAIKFATRLEFNIEEETLAAMKAHANELVRCAPARLQEEIVRLLTSGHAERAMRMCHEVGVFDALMPEFVAAMNAPLDDAATFVFPDALSQGSGRDDEDEGDSEDDARDDTSGEAEMSLEGDAVADASDDPVTEVDQAPITSAQSEAAQDAEVAPDVAVVTRAHESDGEERVEKRVEPESAPMTGRASDVEEPAADVEAPAADAEAPAADAEAPAPVADAEAPAADTEVSADAEAPAADTEAPAADAEAPAADAEAPAADVEAPAADAETPAGPQPQAVEPEPAPVLLAPEARWTQLWSILGAMDAVRGCNADVSASVAFAALLTPAYDALRTAGVEQDAWMERVFSNWAVRMRMTRRDRERLTYMLPGMAGFKPRHRHGRRARQLVRRPWFRDGLMLYTILLHAAGKPLDEIGYWKVLAKDAGKPYQQHRVGERPKPVRSRRRQRPGGGRSRGGGRRGGRRR